ncbi:MAG: ROK family protein [Rhodococcus sp.]|nr:ROK family protein [Rhodococcus sp. (in: high G+C Gram-positive bacteria)]
MGRHGFGIDVGGSGVKGAVVDLDTGELASDRIKILTPQPATPAAIAETVVEITERAGWSGDVGITIPGVVTHGVVRTAANIAPEWINLDAKALFSEALGTSRAVTVVNDADAAGVAEVHFGAAHGHTGLVILLTFGTGIGSALIYNGVIIPNSEFGHMEVGGREAEHQAASSVRENRDLSYPEWAKKVSTVLNRFEDLLWPDLFIAGGGVSRKHEKWVPLLTARTPVVAAQLRNAAGIVGAAMAVDTGVRH